MISGGVGLINGLLARRVYHRRLWAKFGFVLWQMGGAVSCALCAWPARGERKDYTARLHAHKGLGGVGTADELMRFDGALILC